MIVASTAPPTAPRLLVFRDDWGRRPSSCQHLVRHLLPHHPTLWVNTIDIRAPRLSFEDIGKIAQRMSQWVNPGGGGKPGVKPGFERGGSSPPPLPDHLTVTSPYM